MVGAFTPGKLASATNYSFKNFYLFSENLFVRIPQGSEGKESTCNAGDLGLIPGLGRFSWRREQLPTLVFLPGEIHGQRSLAGYTPWGRRESDTTGRLSLHFRLIPEPP